MDGKEFGKFLVDFSAAFPGFESWFRKLPEPAETKRAWFQSVEKFSLTELRLMLDRMLRQDIKHLDCTDYPNFGVEIRTRVRRMLDEDRRTRELAAQRTTPPLAKMTAENPGMARGFVACHRTVGVCRSLGLAPCDEDRCTRAVATLMDSPTAEETSRCHEVLEKFGLLSRLPELTRPLQGGEQISLFCTMPEEEVVAP